MPLPEVRQDPHKGRTDDTPVPGGTGASFRARLYAEETGGFRQSVFVYDAESYSVVGGQTTARNSAMQFLSER